MGKGNNIIANAHFRKSVKGDGKTWFGQPARKIRKKARRMLKITRGVAPRVFTPSGALSYHFRYNTKVRAGRGFGLEELKGAGLNRHFVKTIGISVDHRRRNKSTESLYSNANRLKEYMAKLILYPSNLTKLKKGETSSECCKIAALVTGVPLPIQFVGEPKAKARSIGEAEKKFSAFLTFRAARDDARLIGVRAKRIRTAC